MCMYYLRMASSPDSATPRWDTAVWGLLAVLCGVLFLDGLDVSMVGVALPSIESDLGLTTSSLQWVVSGYVLGYGGFLLLGGRAADLLGRRRVFLVALAVFAVASLLAGVKLIDRDQPARNAAADGAHGAHDAAGSGQRGGYDILGAVTSTASVL